ncbi:MAG: hypothetical protein HQL27_00665 [Candidatus Omnitrophica bacterium]|nr:hypothetical protein [Candidatus Omnitrophota bacterium]
MRRSLVILFAVALFVVTGLSSLSFAQGMKGMMGDQPMMGKGMMKNDMMVKCPIHDMIKGMLEKTVIATSDGGVIVLAGNKLMKYDKDLNLVKEVEIKVDMEAMKKDMAEMMKNCPMMKGGMMGAGMAGQNTPPVSGTEEKK